MSDLHYSAHDLCKTRLCQAAGCENDADAGWALCSHCDERRRRGRPVTIHEVVQPAPPDPDTMLVCNSCSEWKPDNHFSNNRSETTRRNHHRECKTCANERRREYRRTLNPEQREAELERNRIRQRRKRAAAKAAT